MLPELRPGRLTAIFGSSIAVRCGLTVLVKLAPIAHHCDNTMAFRVVRLAAELGVADLQGVTLK